MLKEQLLELQKSKKTILTPLKNKISFTTDESIDTHTLFQLLNFQSEFTTPKSLRFDRHQLSEREERKFNKKFVPFLRGLITEMKNTQINVLLEYFVRVYNIDTFNPKELQFLLLPFPEYFQQLSALKFKDNPLEHILSYSYVSISTAILKNSNLMMNFVQYCSNYQIFAEFIDKITLEFTKKNNETITCNIDAFYQILQNLIQKGHTEKALEIFKSIKELQEYPEIALLFDSIYINNSLLDELYKEDRSPKRVCFSKFLQIYENKEGRMLLNDTFELCKYLEFLKANNLVASEFNRSELSILRNILIKEDNHIDSYQDLNELEGYSLISSMIKKYKENIELKNKEYNEAFILTNINYKPIINNLTEDTVLNKQKELFMKCLVCTTFDCEWFFDKVFKKKIHKELLNNICSVILNSENTNMIETYGFGNNIEIVKANLINFANVICFDITEMLLDSKNTHDYHTVLYLLTFNKKYSTDNIRNIIEYAINMKNTTLNNELIVFICKNALNLPSNVNIEEMYFYFVSNGHACNLEIYLDKFGAQLSGKAHFDYLIKTQSCRFIEQLQSKQPNFVFLLYEYKQYDILLKYTKKTSIQNVLIEHSGVFDFLNHNKSILDNEKHVICKYMIDYIENEAALSFLINFAEILIEFRDSNRWEMIKIILLESLNTRQQYEQLFEWIVDNIELFDLSDEDLIEAVVCNIKNINIQKLKEIKSTATAAIFIDLCIRQHEFDALPILPKIASILIDHKKNSIQLLFEKYTNIMAGFSRKLLEKWSERSELLINLEPLIVLREICAVFKPELAKTLIIILDTRKCSNLNILKKIAECFEKNMNNCFSSENFISFIKFYKRSFGVENKQILSNLITSIYNTNQSKFYEIATLGLEIRADLFYDATVEILHQIETRNGDSISEQSLEFLCEYFKYEQIERFDMSLFNTFYKLKSTKASIICAHLIENNKEYLEKAINTLVKDLDCEETVSFALKTMVTIFKSKKEKGEIDDVIEFKKVIIPHAIVLAEGLNQNISSEASYLLELLQ